MAATSPAIPPAIPPAQVLTEDDLYRTSTQYRLWSFSPSSLSTLRQNTHAAAIAHAHSHLPPTSHSLLPTAQDEVRLVQRYSEMIRVTAEYLQWPVNVKATAVQYLKRFYTTNSILTYPPKEIYKSVLYLAAKTEGVHISASDFARRIKAEAQDILAPEYKIIQALRFTLDVRQPFRGLKGAMMELLNIAAGNGQPLPFLSLTPRDLQSQLSNLPPPPQTSRTTWQPSKPITDRLEAAYSSARLLIDAPALLTDVYFLYTPPQILFAALRLSDEPLFSFYLSTKVPSDSPNHDDIIASIILCAEMLAAYDPSLVMSKDERAELEKRLDECRDPTTKDLVKKNEELKRGGEGEGQLGQGKAEKRKLAREKSFKEGEDLFGPVLGSQQV